MKLCKDCKWSTYKPPKKWWQIWRSGFCSDSIFPHCLHVKAIFDGKELFSPVTGEKATADDFYFCETFRKDREHFCGTKAKYFESRETE